MPTQPAIGPAAVVAEAKGREAATADAARPPPRQQEPAAAAAGDSAADGDSECGPLLRPQQQPPPPPPPPVLVVPANPRDGGQGQPGAHLSGCLAWSIVGLAFTADALCLGSRSFFAVVLELWEAEFGWSRCAAKGALPPAAPPTTHLSSPSQQCTAHSTVPPHPSPAHPGPTPPTHPHIHCPTCPCHQHTVHCCEVRSRSRAPPRIHTWACSVALLDQVVRIWCHVGGARL